MDATRRVTAVLGPTNTGKTHHAIERMLAHPTGMIGLPLRLLPDCCKWGICGWIPRPIQSTPGIPGWS